MAVRRRHERIVLLYPRNMTEFCRRYSLNAYWAGKHWAQRMKDADAVHAMVRAALLEQKIPRRLFERAVRITFTHDDRMDVDNHAALEKMIVDALRGWLLENDSRKWYAEKVSRFGNVPGIVVDIEEMPKPKEKEAKTHDQEKL